MTTPSDVLLIFFGALIFCASAQEIRFNEGQRYSFAYRANQISSEDQYDIGLNHPASGIGSLVIFSLQFTRRFISISFLGEVGLKREIFTQTEMKPTIAR